MKVPPEFRKGLKEGHDLGYRTEIDCHIEDYLKANDYPVTAKEFDLDYASRYYDSYFIMLCFDCPVLWVERRVQVPTPADWLSSIRTEEEREKEARTPIEIHELYLMHESCHQCCWKGVGPLAKNIPPSKLIRFRCDICGDAGTMTVKEYDEMFQNGSKDLKCPFCHMRITSLSAWTFMGLTDVAEAPHPVPPVEGVEPYDLVKMRDHEKRDGHENTPMTPML